MSSPSPGPADLHEWISFLDPEQPDHTWSFDATFLASNWTCIFGNGCQGVLTGPTPERVQGCCSYGAHFVDDTDRDTVLERAAELGPHEWQFRGRAQHKGGPLRQKKDGSWVTRMADDACIFLNRPGFPTGPGCSLHQAAMARGERFMDWKPDVCWQLPLRHDTHVDDNGHTTHLIREWKRRDWGEGGAEFHWWCTDSHEAFVGHRPTYVELRDELIELVGERPYELLVRHLQSRGTEQILPHPRLKRRR